MVEADAVGVAAQVLVANEAFYAAFSQGDADAMVRLWARDAAVTCAHPGMSILFGRDAVVRSWRALLRAVPKVPLQCFQPRVQVLGPVAIVTCYEGAGQGLAHLAATNVFVLEAGEWRMAHHQAGPLQHALRTQPDSSSLN